MHERRSQIITIKWIGGPGSPESIDKGDLLTNGEGDYYKVTNAINIKGK